MYVSETICVFYLLVSIISIAQSYSPLKYECTYSIWLLPIFDEGNLSCSSSVCRVWDGGHPPAGGGLLTHSRDGHLLPGVGRGLQWLRYLRQDKRLSAGHHSVIIQSWVVQRDHIGD